MPEPRELIEDGLHAERIGALDRALESYLEAADAAPDPGIVAEALTRQADVYRARGEWEPALGAARRAQEVARSARLPDKAAHAVIAEANVLMCRSDFTIAAELFRSVLGEDTDQRTRGIALQNLGSILALQGQLGAAERAFADSYACFRRAGYHRGEAIALNNHGRVALDRGEAELAVGLLDAALGLARAVEDEDLQALATLNYAEALGMRGEHVRADELASAALGFFCAAGNRWRQIECLKLIGGINLRRGCAEDATRCYERALRLAEELGARGEVTTMRDRLAQMRASRA